MNKVNNIILTLRIYSGKRLYDATGKLISKNQTMKLSYGRLEWTVFLKGAAMFYTEVEIESATKEVIKDDVKKYNDTKIPADAIAELRKVMGKEDQAKPAKKVAKKEEAKVEEKADEKKENPTNNEIGYDPEDLEAVREKYLEVFGEKPHHAKKAASLNKEIADKLLE